MRPELGVAPDEEDAEPDIFMEGGGDVAEVLSTADRLRFERQVDPDDDPQQSFAHILVDEGQDVTPMQWRMLRRRGPQSSWTIVGDPAQLEAVDAGGFLGHVERNLDHTTLDTVWRFKNEWERAASLKLRSINDKDGIDAVVNTYDEHDRIHGDPDHEADDDGDRPRDEGVPAHRRHHQRAG